MKKYGGVLNRLIAVSSPQKHAMQHVIAIHCRYCHSNDLVKNGHAPTGTQRYRCNACRKSFQLTYHYNAWKEGTKDQIDTLTLNSAGVRDIGRSLQISANTVVAHLKKSAPKT